MATTPTEIKTIFTIDLKPFTLGLKTMLTMTQAAGQQIPPLLNLQMKAPNFSVFDAQLKELQKNVDDYVGSEQQAAQATKSHAQAENTNEGATRKSSDAVKEKAVSLRHMKRESLESFGAISFLIQNVVTLGARTGEGNEKLEKMSRSMSEGISAGFGLASTMAILGVATGGTAALIGAAVATGISLLTFFSDGEGRAKRMQAALDLFNNSLRGASQRDLTAYRQALVEDIKTIDKHIEALEKQRAAAGTGFESPFGIVQGIDAVLGTTITRYGAVNKLIDEQKEKRKLQTEELKKLDQEETTSQLTAAEVKKRIIELNIQTEQNGFQQRRLLADQELTKELERIAASNASNDDKIKAMNAANQARLVATKKIDDEERQEKDQHVMRLAEIEDRRRLSFIDVQEKLALAASQTEFQRLAITEKFALDRLKVEEEAARRSIELEIKRQQAIGGDEAERKIARLQQVLAGMDKEFADKRISTQAITNERLIQLGVQNADFIRDTVKQTLLTQLDAEEKQALSKETSEKRRTEIAREYALKRLEIERQAAEQLVQLELIQLQGATGEQAALRRQQLQDRLAALNQLFGAKKNLIEMEVVVKTPPPGSIAAQLQKLQQLQEQFNQTSDTGARKRIRTEIDLEQQKLDRMTLFGGELVQKERQIQEERRQLWIQTHEIQMALITTLSSTARSMFNQLFTEQRRTSQESIAIRNEENRLSALQLQQQRRDLNQQLEQKTISQEEYALRMQQLNLSQRQRDQDNLQFQQQLDEERKSSLQRAYEGMLNVVVDVGGAILQKTIENYLIDLLTKKAVETEKTVVTTAAAIEQAVAVSTSIGVQTEAALASVGIITPAVVASMQAIAAAAAAAATFVSVATFGGAAVAGEAALISALLTTKAAMLTMSIPGFEKGGKTKKGEAGIIEGFAPEIIAPEKDFYHIARTEMIPQLLMEQDRQLDIKFSKNMTAKFQAAGGTSNNSEVLTKLDRLEAAIKGLYLEAKMVDGTEIKAILRNVQYKDKRTGLS